MSRIFRPMKSPAPASEKDSHWPAAAAGDPLDGLVHLSHQLGRDPRLVQPGGGNTSIKVTLPGEGGTAVEALLVKGSGTDLRTIGRDGFTRLSLSRLNALAGAASMSDAEMMKFMSGCMLAEGPAPSVETPLHSLLPHRVIAHTHDVATMSLTNVSDATAERLVAELFEGRIVYVPYTRPGFPLARSVSLMAGRIPAGAIGLTLAHHGLVIFGEDPRQCHERLLLAVAKMDEFIAASRRGRQLLGPPRRPVPPPAERHRLAEVVLPAVRGALGAADRVVLHYDDSEDLLQALSAERLPELSRRGMATPEHLLRAGRLPIWLDLDPSAPPPALVSEVRTQLQRQHAEYEEYHRRYATPDQRPLDDWAKVVLVPGVGMITAFSDKRSAITANLCYRAVLQAIENAEAVAGFEFIPEPEVFEFEHWPLERRKVEEQLARDRSSKLVPRSVAVVIGGGSGIGRAAVERFAAEGAHVVAADLDAALAEAVASEVGARFPERVIGVAADVTDEASLEALFRRTVLEFGGLDHLFYTAGLPPRFAPVTEITRADLQRQLDVHYLGAVQAVAGAARIMRAQGRGGSIVASVSKAALVPGRDAVAYGGSKAAMLQALRVAAVELGADGIRVNAINADQIETPLFLQFVRERAASRGVTMDEQLATYRRRNLMGVSLIPAEAVADLAVLLASDKFRFTTGGILTVDGGLPEAFPR
jgi:rhamnose utilization protein RhaD (predicted bifunctional aldolase and dehydrogenase)/NAD(P)-dependent dehydrogenase (short-subunit alcohol dehydrogenase family)